MSLTRLWKGWVRNLLAQPRRPGRKPRLLLGEFLEDRLAPAAATHYVISAPAAATAGNSFTFTVTAEDDTNATDTGYAGTVHFTSTDGSASLPLDSALTNGTGTFTATLDTAGDQTITGTDTVTSSITGTSNTITVSAAAATHFAVSPPASATAGNATTFTVTALDPFNNTDTAYAGTVHFTSTDGNATLPSDSTLTNGTGTFGVTLRTAGNQTITGTDTVNSSITGTSSPITVSAAAATHFAVSAPASATAGSAFNFTVTALDPFDNTDTAYAGTVTFSSTDGAATLPSNSTLTNGTGTFSATLRTAGSQTVTATDTATSSITGTSGPIAVSAAAASHFAVSAPPTATIGSAFNFTVTALDPFNNTATAYAGTVHFTSTDGAATLPTNSTLTNGTGTFGATLHTAGSQTLTATDTVTSSVTGTSGPIAVSGDIVIGGGVGDDSVIVTATGPASGSYSVNGGPAVAFNAITSFTFNGAAGNDRLVVNNPAPAGLFAPTGGVFFDGGTQAGPPGDRLVIQGGQAVTEMVSFTPDPVPGQHNGTIALVNGGTTANYSFANLSPVLINAGTPTDITFNLPAGDGDNQAILTDDGGPGDPDLTNDPGFSAIVSGNGTFEYTEFANPSGSLSVNASNDGETITVAPLDTGFVAPITLTGGTGNDTFDVTPNQNSTAATTVADGNAPTTPPGDALNVNVAGTTDPTLTISSNTGGSLSGSYTFGNAGAVSFTSIETLSPTTADLGVAKADTPDPVLAGTDLTYSITVTNTGPLASQNVTLSDATPANTTLVTFAVPAGWTRIDTTAAGAAGTVAATNPNVAPGTTSVFTLVVHVGPDTAGGSTIGNTAAVASATTADANAANDQATATTTVATAADLQVTKTSSAGTGTVTAGNLVTYTITLTNAGPSDAQAVVLTDTLTANETFQTSTDSGTGTFTPSTTGNTTTFTATGPFATGAAHTFVITARVNSNTADGTTAGDTADAASTGPTATPDPDTTNNTATASNNVVTSADVQVVKTGPAAITAGQNITYSITFSNAGPSDATAALLTDSVPASTTFVSFAAPPGWTVTTQPAVGGTGNVSATDPDLVAGAGPQVFTLVVATDPNAAAGFTATNTATGLASPSDPDTTNNSSTVTTAVDTSADLGVTKTDTPDPVFAGANLTYTISLTNAGPNPAQAVALTDAVPANTTFVSFTAPAGWVNTTPAVGGTGTVTSTRTSVGSGAAPVFTLVVQVGSGTAINTTITNTATVGSTTADPVAANNSSTATTNVLTQADIAVTKTGPAAAPAGTSFTYTITVTNAGPSDAQSVTLTDNIPAAETIQGASAPAGGSVSVSGNVVTFTVGTLAAGGTATATITVTTDEAAVADGTALTNTASGSTTTAESDATNNSGSLTTTITNQADLGVTKTGPAAATPGTPITYTVTLTNAGPNTARSVSLTDAVPANTTFVSAAPVAGQNPDGFSYTLSGGTVTGTPTGGTVAAGSADQFVVVVTLNSGTPGGTVITNSATGSMSSAVVIDPNSANDTGTATTTASTPSADVAVTKTGPAAAAAGTQITYTVTVADIGPSDAQSVQFTDTVPANTSFVSAATSQGTVSQAGGVITGNLGTVTPTTPAVITIVVGTAPGVPDGTVVTNAATAVGTTADPDTTNNTGTSSTTINASADLSVTKTGPAAATPGTLVTYTITVTNAGPSDAQSVAVTDTTPANTIFSSQAQTSGPAFTLSDPGAGNTGTVSDTIATLHAGESASFQVVVRVASNTLGNTAITDTATVASPTGDPDATNNTSSVTTTTSGPSADVAVTKTDTPDPVVAGTGLTYTLSVTNTGPSDAQNVQLTDNIPADTTFASFVSISQGSASSGGGVVTASLGTVPAGGSATFVFVVTVAPATPTGTVITNTAVETSDTSDPNAVNDSFTQTTDVVTSADLGVTKTGPATAISGTQVTYTLSVTNTGPSDAQGVNLSDTLPAGVTFVSASAGTGTGGTYTDAIGTLAAGGSATVTVVALVAPGVADGTTLTDTASVTATTTDPDSTNNTATLNTTAQASADLAVTKTGPATANAGEQVTYTLSVTNGGPSDAQNVLLSDTLPAGEAFVSASTGTGTGTSYSSGNLGTLAAGASLTVTVVAAISPSQPAGTVTDTATVSSTTTDPNAANNTATFDTTVATSADVQITKTGPATATAGTDVTYTITVTNAGPSDAQTVQTSDTPPPNTSLVSFVQDTGPANGGTLPAGGTETFTLVLHLNPDAADGSTLTNTAQVTSTTTDPDATNNTATAASTVTTSADLSVTKTGPATANAGEQVTYTITVSNAGPSDAQGVTITDTLPAGETFVSASTGTGTGTSFTATLGTLAFGVSTAVTLVAQIDPAAAPGTPLTDAATATATTADANPANNTATTTTTTTTSADVSVTKTGPATGTAGTQVTYTLSVSNAGPSDAQAVFLTDTLPAGMTFVSASEGSGAGTGFVDAIGTLAAGATRTVTLIAAIDPAAADGSTLTDTATVGSTTTDANPANNTGTFATTVATSADLSVTKAGPATAFAGTQVTYTLTVSNAGPSDAQGVTLSDTLPVGVTFVSASEGSGTGGTYTDAIGTLAFGATRTITLVALIDSATAANTPLTDSATATATTADANPANNTGTATTTTQPLVDVSVGKAGSPDPVVAGTNLTYTITVTNVGPSDAQAVTLSDALPPGETFVSATQTSGPTFGLVSPPVGTNGAVVGTIVTLPMGGTATFELVAQVASAVADGAVLSNTATVSTVTPESDTSNDSATADTTVIRRGDLAITKTDNLTSVVPGQTRVTYTIVATNTGPSDQTGASLTDLVPAALTGVTFTSTTTGGATGNTPAGAGSITDTVNMPAGSSITYVLSGLVDAAATGNLTNTAQVQPAFSGTDPDLTNNAATDTDTLSPAADLSVAITGPAQVLADHDLTYAITLTGGPSDAPNVVLTDAVPPGTTFVSFTAPSGWAVTAPPAGSAGTVTATRADLPGTAIQQTFVLVVRADIGSVPNSVITNTVAVASGVPDPNPANNTASAATTVITAPLPIVTGVQDHGARVRVFAPVGLTLISDFLAFGDSTFTGEVRVATGDVNGDGVADFIVGAGAGGGPRVRVFDGRTAQPLPGMFGSFFAFADPRFTGGVYVAAGDINGDGYADVIVGAGAGGGPRIQVFSGKDGAVLRDFYAYAPSFSGGVRVAAGDVNGDGKADIVTTAGPGGGAQVEAFSGQDGAVLVSFLAMPAAGRDGLYVGAGDLNGDGIAEIITGNATGASEVKVFDRTGHTLADFPAYEPQFTGGVRVGVVDHVGGGLQDVATGAGPTGTAHIKVFDGIDFDERNSFLADAQPLTTGVYVG